MRTKQLLTRLERLHQCEEGVELSDFQSAEELAAVSDKIVFKKSQLWKDAYRDLKAILATREHLPRGAEKKLSHKIPKTPHRNRSES